jgi:hypothetical protein
MVSTGSSEMSSVHWLHISYKNPKTRKEYLFHGESLKSRRRRRNVCLDIRDHWTEKYFDLVL